MSVYNKLIQIQKLNEDTNSYEDYFKCHAQINKTGGNEYLIAGVVSTKNKFNFNIRYCQELKKLQFDTQLFRIIYNNIIFNIIDCDDYMQNHHTLKIIGEQVNG